MHFKLYNRLMQWNKWIVNEYQKYIYWFFFLIIFYLNVGCKVDIIKNINKNQFFLNSNFTFGQNQMRTKYLWKNKLIFFSNENSYFPMCFLWKVDLFKNINKNHLFLNSYFTFGQNQIRTKYLWKKKLIFFSIENSYFFMCFLCNLYGKLFFWKISIKINFF